MEQENLESKVSLLNTQLVISAIGISFFGLGVLISRYYFESEQATEIFEKCIIGGIGYTIGYGIADKYVNFLKNL